MRTLLLAEFYSTPWAVLPHTYAVMCEVLERWDAGVRLSAEEIRTAVGEAPELVAARRAAAARAGQGVVAVMPVYGVLTQRGSVSDVSGSGGTSVARLAAAFGEAAADSTVGAIVLDIDSAGGSVFGISELAQQIYDARAAKPVVAVVNSMAASAAYWLAAAASEIVITPSGEAGSIGVITTHKDKTKAMEAAGVKETIVSAGKYKAEGWSGPLSAEAIQALQERVDAYYETMVKDIARGRNVAQKVVREGFGEGRVLGAARAVKEGLADRIGTLDQVLGELVSRARPAGSRADGGAAPQVAAVAKASPLELRERNDF